MRNVYKKMVNGVVVKATEKELQQQREEQYKDMIEWCVHHGIEDGHYEADTLVAQLLRELGYGKVADAFEALPKWYA